MGEILGLLSYGYPSWLLCVNFRYSSLVWPRKAKLRTESRKNPCLLNFCHSFLGLPSPQHSWAQVNMLGTPRPNTTRGMAGTSHSSPCAILVFYCRNYPTHVLIILVGPQSLCGEVHIPELDACSSSGTYITPFIFSGLLVLFHRNLGLNQQSLLLKLKQPLENSCFYFEMPSP